MGPTRVTRRSFLRTAAAGAAALSLPAGGVAEATSGRAPVSIEFWNPATDPVGHGILSDLTNRFNVTIGKAEGIVVHDRTVPSDNAYVKYTTAMTSTGSPDVIMTYSSDILAGWAANGFLQPMDAFAEQLRLKESDFYPIVWRSAHINGRLWGLMQEFDMCMLGINRAIHKGPAPRTIAELDALAARYTTFDKKGNLAIAGLIPWDEGGIYLWSAALGASYYDHAHSKWTINTPANRKVLEWMLKYAEMLGGPAKASDLESAGGHLSSSYGVFYTGTTAFGAACEYDLVDFPKVAPHLNYGIASLPTGPGVVYGSNYMPGGNLFLLPTKAPHPREAAVFIRFMASTSGVMEWCTREGNMPPLPDGVPALMKAFPGMKPFVETVQFNHLVPLISSPQTTLFEAELSTAVQDVTFKRKTPAQALADVESKVSAAVQLFQQTHPTWTGE
jgi:multiple sugar transport system substrate-binding protein